MQRHIDQVQGVVHLPGGRIITCLHDGSLRLWDLESSAQIGDRWQDEGDKSAVYTISLSPNGNIVASGSQSGTVRLWDAERGKVITKWTGHTERVCSVCWSADGKRLVSGSWDGMARVWNVKSGKTIMAIKTGHNQVWVAIYSPDNRKIATGGDYENAVKIWDAQTGELFVTLKHFFTVSSLAWTSDDKKLISASLGTISVFNTTTWQQIAILEGHGSYVPAISLSRNDRLLASASDDKTARLWDLDTNLSVSLPLQHEDKLQCAAFSADGQVLVIRCHDTNVYTWDVYAILKEAGLEDLLHIDNIASKDRLKQKASQGEPGIERTSRSSLSDKSFLAADATQYGPGQFGGVDELPAGFFDGMEAEVHFPVSGGAHPHSSASAFLARLASLLHRFRPDNVDANEPSQPLTLSGLHLRVLFARLSSLIHRSPPQNDAPNELQQPSTSSRLDLHTLLARLSSLLTRSRLNTDEETEPQPTSPSGSRPDALINLLSSLFRSQPHTSEETELSQRVSCLRVVDVAAMRDREVLFVASPLKPDRQRTQPNGTTAPGARRVYSRPIRLLGHIGLYLCCVCQHTDVNAQPTQQQQDQSQGQAQTHVTSRTQQQQQGHSQGQVQAQATPSQTQPAAPSTSAVPTTSNSTLTPGAASA